MLNGREKAKRVVWFTETHALTQVRTPRGWVVERIFHS